MVICLNGSSVFVKNCVTGFAESNSIFIFTGGKCGPLDLKFTGKRMSKFAAKIRAFNQIAQQITNVRVVK